MQGDERLSGGNKAEILPEGYLIDNRYEVEQWWRGGMAVVYQTRDVKTGKIYAVKMPLTPGRQLDKSATKQFRDEIVLLLELPVDQHIVQVYRAGVDNSRPYLVMEYVPGGSLAARLGIGQRLTYEQAMDFAFQICVGMERASSRGEVAHLDLKPSNVLIASDGLLKVSDFGIAQHTQAFLGGPIKTKAGTPIYMSPEQLADEPVDVRSDIFSFGVILFEMLMGNLPYPTELVDDNAENVRRLALLHRVLREDIPLTRQLAIDNDIVYDSVSTVLNYVGSHRESMGYLARQQLDQRGLDQRIGRIVAGCLSNYASDRFPDFTSIRRRLTNDIPDLIDQRPAIGERKLTPDEWYLRGTTYQSIDFHTKALRCFNKSLVSNTDGPPSSLLETYLGAVRSCLALGDETSAVQLLNQAEAVEPGDSHIAKLRQQLKNTDHTLAASDH